MKCAGVHHRQTVSCKATSCSKLPGWELMTVCFSNSYCWHAKSFSSTLSSSKHERRTYVHSDLNIWVNIFWGVHFGSFNFPFWFVVSVRCDLCILLVWNTQKLLSFSVWSVLCDHGRTSLRLLFRQDWYLCNNVVCNPSHFSSFRNGGRLLDEKCFVFCFVFFTLQITRNPGALLLL